MLSKIKEIIAFSKLYLKVAKNPFLLKDIQNPHYLICKKAVEVGGTVLHFVPDEYKTEEMSLIAVRKSGFALQYVKKQTPIICMEAVKEQGYALEFVVDKTPDICLEAVKRNGDALCWVPEDFKTSEMCFIAINQSGISLEHISSQNKTYEMCLEAVKNHAHALRYVPENFQTDELVKAAIVKNTGSLCHVINQTPEVCLMALKLNAQSLRDVKIVPNLNFDEALFELQSIIDKRKIIMNNL